jgi:hypothetical protein
VGRSRRRRGGQLEQLLARVATACKGGVCVEEIARQGAAEERTDFARDGIVCVQDWTNVELHRVMRTRVSRQLDLLRNAIRRVDHRQAGKRLGLLDNGHRISRRLKRRDDSSGQRRELLAALPAREKINIAAEASAMPCAGTA